MRFPHSFKRYVGKAPEGGKELGTDKAPTSETARVPTPDNVFESRVANIHGYPVQRLAVGYSGPKGAPELVVAVFVYDDTSERWYQSGIAQQIAEGTLSYFDVPLLLDNARTGGGEGLKSQGALEAMIVVEPNGGSHKLKAPEGTYIFIAGADVSNPGI
jgi:hypothetical protein